MRRFNQFFFKATGFDPYEYQNRLACGERGAHRKDDWLKNGNPCESRLIDVPTDLGKTAAAVMAWLWNRIAHPDPAHKKTWPRRLVYCLPMRTLVEQTRDNVRDWVERLATGCPENSDLQCLSKHSPVVLMGGEELDPSKCDWDMYPENPAILIGTQDMLLSRALNRGYGMSRYRWPMHFGLLNNDCLWVMDEVQLMGSGLWTTAQLDWMRWDRFKSFKPCASWWMSATLGESFFETPDRSQSKIPAPKTLALRSEEETSLAILEATRPIKSYPPNKTLTRGSRSNAKKADETELYFHDLAKSIVDEHLNGNLTLAVCNRVAYAQRLKDAIQTIQAQSESSNQDVLLLTSRFRLRDRKATVEKVVDFEVKRKKGQPHPGVILVSTPVIEAGFDVSAARLWTEAAPWPSFVQRLGRLNRDAKLNGVARAFVFTVPVPRGDVGPYEPEDLQTGAQIVSALEKLCAERPNLPARQASIELSKTPDVAKRIREALQPKTEPCPRAFDLHGLFSTEPDVFGGFTDISPWVRNVEANPDVTVFWRRFKPNDQDAVNSGEGPGLQRDELCPVSVSRLREFLKDSRKAWFWEPKKKRWETIRPADLCPGMTLMLPAAYGGYEVSRGWTGETGSMLEDVALPGLFEDGEDEDRESLTGN